MVTRIPAKKAAQKPIQQPVRQKVDAASGTPAVTRERMSRVDTAWLRMDSPMNLMMILGVWIIKPGVSSQAVSQRIEEPLLQYPLFCLRLELDASCVSWVTDSSFNI